MGMSASSPRPDAGDSLAADFARILWRAKVVILAGAAVAATFAFVSTQRPRPTYEAEALLVRTEADAAPMQATTTIILTPPSTQSGLQLAMPAGLTGTPSLDLDTIEYLVKGQGVLSGIAGQLGEEFEQSGLTTDVLADCFSVSDVPRTKLVAVHVIMPSATLAVKTADAVAKALIEQDQAAVSRASQTRIQQIDSELKALRRAIAVNDTPSDEPKIDGVDDTRLMKLMYAGLVSRYRQALVESATQYTRLRVVQPPVASEHVAAFPRRRNTAMGFVAGALLASIVALGLNYWRTAGRPRAQLT
jgi:uncharacterized protein involved in exopolysaccharide biosynthesis